MFLALKIHESETQEQFGLKRQIGILWYIGRAGETTRFLVLGFFVSFFFKCVEYQHEGVKNKRMTMEEEAITIKITKQ